FLTLFYRHFVGTGFFEEFVKVMPLLLIVLTVSRMSPEWKQKLNIEEPLDGIVFGAAAGGGFAIMETLVQYVPQYGMVVPWIRLGAAFNHVALDPRIDLLHIPLTHQLVDFLVKGKELLGASLAGQLVITRSLDEAFGHMAYSGYFGYFIGLSVLKPEHRWRT